MLGLLCPHILLYRDTLQTGLACNFLPIYQSSLVCSEIILVIVTTPALVSAGFINWLLCKSSRKVEIWRTDSNHQDWLLNIKGGGVSTGGSQSVVRLEAEISRPLICFMLEITPCQSGPLSSQSGTCL